MICAMEVRLRYAQVSVNPDLRLKLFVHVEPPFRSEFVSVRAPNVLVPTKWRNPLKSQDSHGNIDREEKRTSCTQPSRLLRPSRQEQVNLCKPFRIDRRWVSIGAGYHLSWVRVGLQPRQDRLSKFPMRSGGLALANR